MAPLGSPFVTDMVQRDSERFLWLTRECENRDESDAKYKYIIGLLQEVRVESKNLWELFGEMEKEILNKQSQDNLAEVVKPYQSIYEGNKGEIENLIKDLRTILDNDSRFVRHMGDEIRSIENYWERFLKFYPNLSDPSSDKILHSMEKCTNSLSEIIFQCSYRTIPDRLMGHLNQAEIPQALNFYDTFQDEVCSKEQAEKILMSISRSAKIIKDETRDLYGAVDTVQGLVYRVGSTREQWKTVFWIALACFGSLVLSIFVLAMYKLYINTTSSLNGLTVIVLFIVMLAGAIAHIAIAVLKEARSETKTRNIHAITDLLLWTHIKAFTFYSGLAVLVVAFLTVVIMYPGIGVETAFVVGYSIDSLGDLYLDRFDSIMSAKSDVLKTGLKAP
jgi:hypothetical protein